MGGKPSNLSGQSMAPDGPPHSEPTMGNMAGNQQQGDQDQDVQDASAQENLDHEVLDRQPTISDQTVGPSQQEQEGSTSTSTPQPPTQEYPGTSTSATGEEINSNNYPAGSTTGSGSGSCANLVPKQSPSPTKSDYTDAREYQEGPPDCATATSEREDTVPATPRLPQIEFQPPTPDINTNATSEQENEENGQQSPTDDVLVGLGISGVSFSFSEVVQEELQGPDGTSIDNETGVQTDQQEALQSAAAEIVAEVAAEVAAEVVAEAVAAAAAFLEWSNQPQPPPVQGYAELEADTDTDSEDGSEGGLVLEQTDIDTTDGDGDDDGHGQLEEESPLPSDPAPALIPAQIETDREAQIGTNASTSPNNITPGSDSHSNSPSDPDNGSHMVNESGSPSDEAVDGGASLSLSLSKSEPEPEREPHSNSTAVTAQHQDRLLSLQSFSLPILSQPPSLSLPVPPPPPPLSPPLSLPSPPLSPPASPSPPVNATATVTVTATASDYISSPPDPATSQNIPSFSPSHHHQPSDLRAGPQQELPLPPPVAAPPARLFTIPIRLRSAAQLEQKEQPDSNMSSNPNPAHNGNGNGNMPSHGGARNGNDLTEEEIRRIMMEDDDFDPIPAEYRQGAGTGNQFTPASHALNMAPQQSPYTTNQALQPYNGRGGGQPGPSSMGMAYTQVPTSNTFGYHLGSLHQPPLAYDRRNTPAMPHASYNMGPSADPRLAYPPPTGPRGRGASPYVTPTIAAALHTCLLPVQTRVQAMLALVAALHSINQVKWLVARGMSSPARGATVGNVGRQSANQGGQGPAPGGRPGGISGQVQDGQQGDNGDAEDSTGGVSLSRDGNGDGEWNSRWN
ncbi:hypothetical protein LTR99_003561 [Exophiala xenobiotica]|uniref:Uncharacterized protein n=1 Tax=Vermiconidia calcicola TaxID=1690605 RepID=A0AAV9Q1P1_9PEZI|nr:hypothetical protein LTR92_008783 [Exophiala xenobiotica]KAK5529649.1 hypothetical protein LTR23_010620 [Chaetothyriales sp. CCFEE 6169]KAK5531256.1 hypothetical protein LTR25_008363 [Vermiconidia calcicola]KAK5264254.1 hypothetical protein LTR96_010271 [Exophiala xenobiotica]KAK5304498.1 hypothetical protein LTR99_003561 [Exophiala xenobiotica]